jgi:hypothetical protein
MNVPVHLLQTARYSEWSMHILTHFHCLFLVEYNYIAKSRSAACSLIVPLHFPLCFAVDCRFLELTVGEMKGREEEEEEERKLNLTVH